MNDNDGLTRVFSYSWWSNYGQLIYGLLFPLVFIAWIFLTPTRIIHCNWGIAILVAYYAYQFGMVWYRLIKTPQEIMVTGETVNFRYLNGRTVSWDVLDISEIENSIHRQVWFADRELIVTRKDGNGVIIIRPEVKAGHEKMVEAFRQAGVTVKDSESPKGATDG